MPHVLLHPLHRGFHPDPHIMEWLRLAAFILIVLAALLALGAMVFLSQSPEGLPLIMTRQ